MTLLKSFQEGSKKEIIYRTYIPYEIFIPSFFTDEERLHNVNKFWWWFCRLRFWRYKMNMHCRFLVQNNGYTRPWHFTEDYEHKATWNDTLGTLRGLC